MNKKIKQMTMTEQQVPQSILDKIQKIANLKEGAEAVGNHSEAEAAASQMLKLLLKYNLDMETVSASQVAKKANIEEVKFTTEQDKRETEWVSKLYVAVAKNYMCVIWNYGTFVRIIGHSDNVSFVAYACEQLVSKIRIGEKLSWNRYTSDNPNGEKRGTYRRGFFTGAVTGIWHRLYDEMNAAKVVKDDNPYAVMIVNKEQEVMDWLLKKYPPRTPTPTTGKPKKVKLGKGPRQTKSNAGMNNGYEAGKAMSINKGVAHTEPKANINN